MDRDIAGADPGGCTRCAPIPPLKLEKIWLFFFCENRDFSHEIPQKFSHLPPLGAIFFKCAPLTWNHESGPVLYICNAELLEGWYNIKWGVLPITQNIKNWIKQFMQLICTWTSLGVQHVCICTSALIWQNYNMPIK